MASSAWGWAIAFVLAVVLLRALAWYSKRNHERKQYARGMQAIYDSFRSEADPVAVARHKVRILHTDANHILTRAHNEEKYSRRFMYRRFRMSARRWNSAYGILKEIDAMPLGLRTREESYRKLQERILELYEACNHVKVLPFD